MTLPKVYQYPKCSTCRKALAFLAKKDVEFDSVDTRDRAAFQRS